MNFTSSTHKPYKVISDSKLYFISKPSVSTVAISTTAGKQLYAWSASGSNTTIATANQYKQFTVATPDYSNAFNKKIWEFSYSGTGRQWVAPHTGTYTMECWGGDGGGISALPGGTGGYCKGNLAVNNANVFYVYVGGVGGTSNTEESAVNSGGWNGGGISSKNVSGGPGAGGGGSTDIRLLLANTSDLSVWNNTASLRTRIMVAGGGGGTGLKAEHGMIAGCGGGLQGGTGTSSSDSEWQQQTWVSLGGTQTSATRNTGNIPESEWNAQGGFGYASQTLNTRNWWGGGGGGGWYGGQKGGGVGGAGGSSFISGHLGCNPVNTSTGVHIGAYTGANTAFTVYGGKTYQFTGTQMIDGNGIEWTLANQTRIYENASNPGVVNPSGSAASIPAKPVTTNNGFTLITYIP